jgi:type II secretory pathway pseudopilin PulG
MTGAGLAGRSRGFSLLELVTVCALAAALLGMAVPNLRRLAAPWALRGATRQVAAGFHVARQRAITRNARYRLRFRAPRGFVLEREIAPGRFTAEGGLQQLPRGARLGRVRPREPVFDTRGMLAQTARVPIVAEAGGRRTVTVNVLGRTSIQ